MNMMFKIHDGWNNSKLNPKKRYATCVSNVQKKSDDIFEFTIYTGFPMSRCFGYADYVDNVKYNCQKKKIIGRFRVYNRNEILECIENAVQHLYANGTFR